MIRRRDFIGRTARGTVGVSLGALALAGCSSPLRRQPRLRKTRAINPGKSDVSFAAGSDRRSMIREVLKPFENEIGAAIQNKQVVIKLNCVGQHGNPLMVTPPDAVRGILDFLVPLYDKRVIIAESTVADRGSQQKTFELFGYTPLEKEYNAICVEQNEQPTTWQWILDRNLFPTRIRVINTFLDPNNYIISVTRLKTHNCVVATLSLKNIVMGSPLKIPERKINDKAKMHAGSPSQKYINFNLFLMAQRVRPDFAVLDGFEGVEGNGPADGDPVDHRVALAGPDWVSVDRMGVELMGIPFEDIGYLNYCAEAGLGQADRSKIQIIGPDPGAHVIKYRLHDNIERQYNWRDEIIPVKREDQ